MKTRFLKLALLAVFCVGATATNAQNKLSDEAVKVIKELKQVDTKGLSAEDAQTVMKVLNQIKRENSPRVEMLDVYHRGSQMSYPRVELAGMKVEAIPVAEKPLFILDGKEISIEEFNGLNPNCVEGLKLIKGEEAVNKYGEKAANGVLFITSVNANQEKVQVTGFTTIRKGKGDVTTEPIANLDLAVKAVNLNAVNQGNLLLILDGIEISEEKLKSLDPNSIEKLELRKGEIMKRLYGEKAADGVLVITSKNANQEKVQVTGFTTIRKGKGDVTTEPIANVDIAVKAVEKGNIIILFDGIEISQEKFKGLNPDDVEKIELRKGEIMKVLYGEKGADGALFITSKKAAAENEQRAARRANVKNVHVVTKADLKPVDREAMAKVISCVEPMLHVRGSMAKIESVNSDELPRVTKFKQKGNQVSFRIEVPKSADRAKQKVDIEYELPAEK